MCLATSAIDASGFLSKNAARPARASADQDCATVVVTSRTRGMSLLSLTCNFFTVDNPQIDHLEWSNACFKQARCVLQLIPRPLRSTAHGVCQQKTLEFKQLLIPSSHRAHTRKMRSAGRTHDACCTRSHKSQIDWHIAQRRITHFPEDFFTFFIFRQAENHENGDNHEHNEANLRFWIHVHLL